MFKLQIYVSVDYGIWPRFCLPAPPPRPGASRASVYVGGWISVACPGASLNSLADVYLSHCEVGLGLSLEGAGGKGCALNLTRDFLGFQGAASRWGSRRPRPAL